MIESEKISLKVSFFPRRDPDGPVFFLDDAVGAIKPSTNRYKANFNHHYWFRLSESDMIYF